MQYVPNQLLRIYECTHIIWRYQLIGELSCKAEIGVLLIVVDVRLDDPLQVEGGEAAALVVQLRDEVVCPVWLQLNVCTQKPKT